MVMFTDWMDIERKREKREDYRQGKRLILISGADFQSVTLTAAWTAAERACIEVP